ALHTCLPIYHARVLLMVNDTRLSLSTLIIHVYIARPARGAKHLLTTTRTTHDRSTRGNFGVGGQGQTGVGREFHHLVGEAEVAYHGVMELFGAGPVQAHVWVAQRLRKV